MQSPPFPVQSPSFASPPMSPMSEGEADFDRPRSLKVLFVGDCGVGKSNLISRLTNGSFDLESKTTVGLSRFSKHFQVGDTRVKVNLWDTGKAEKDSPAETKFKFDKQTTLCLVYDVTKRNTFSNIENKWVTYLKRYFDFETGVVMLVGNKKDLQHLRDVTTEAGKKYAKTNGFLFAETSALENTNVEATLQQILSEIVRRIGIEQANLNESMDNINPAIPEFIAPSGTAIPATSSCLIS